MAFNGNNLTQQIQALTIWRNRGQRAPHKPLLLLMALAAVAREDERLTPYPILAEKLTDLLNDFGAPRKSQHPEYPFWRLQNDGDFWEVPEKQAAKILRGDRKRSGDVPPKVLIQAGAQGGFSAEAHHLLRGDQGLVNRISAELLDAHFPPSLHDAILDAVEMPWKPTVWHASNSGFRDTMLRIYEYQCAVCGFDGRLGSSDVCLEAAHVKWRAADGPDTEDNGLLLCNLHHRLLDRGVIGITEDRRVTVSQHLNGGPQVAEWVMAFSGKPYRPPQSGCKPVAREYIEWHGREVFRAPARG